ncbi:Rieske (2Fe-2S) protein [Peribacillus cavernae]|nr:Rieske (2Fe-2S) protein [Peribacillus cavernae]MDQ0219415.1 nitrite reductase/ring-hydroxylating ferredoxin subunit [Peribacillus cavernae]
MMPDENVAGNVEDFPVGSHKVIKIGKREIGVFNVDGAFYALPNICPHQVGPLCQGKVSGTLVANKDTNWKRTWDREGEILACPWHRLEFNIKTGECLAYPEVKIRSYNVKIEEGKVKVW